MNDGEERVDLTEEDAWRCIRNGQKACRMFRWSVISCVGGVIGMLGIVVFNLVLIWSGNPSSIGPLVVAVGWGVYMAYRASEDRKKAKRVAMIVDRVLTAIGGYEIYRALEGR